MKSSRKHDGDNAYLHIDYQPSTSTATNCIRFIECLPVPSGALAGQGKLIKLMPWQRELIHGIYPDKGKPRNEVLLSIARRNGKSVTLAGIMCFLMFNTHKKSRPVPGSLMVSAACNREQASFIFDIIALWCSTVVELNEASDISHYHRVVNVLTSKGTKYKAIAANARAALGGQYSVVICDEIGFWRDNKLQLALRSGMASTPPEKRLFLQASTVPADQENHFFYDELKYFAGNQSSPTHYALVRMTNPKVDAPNAERTWKKANPSYGILVNKESFVDEYRSAKNFPQRMQGFVSYRCNAPIAPMIDDTARFIATELWNTCKGDSKLLAGEQVVVAWDAASTRDLTSVVAMSVEPPHRTECLFIVPKLAVADNTNIPYRLWSEQGFCTLATTDYVSKQLIVDHYLHLLNSYEVVASQSDLYGYPEIAQLCDQQSVSLEAHTARHIKHADYNDGLEKLAELIRSNNLLHDNPLLTYCVTNMRIKRTRTGATIVDRDLSIQRGNKIDGGICLMLCSLLVASTSTFASEVNLGGLILE